MNPPDVQYVAETLGGSPRERVTLNRLHGPPWTIPNGSSESPELAVPVTEALGNLRGFLFYRDVPEDSPLRPLSRVVRGNGLP